MVDSKARQCAADLIARFKDGLITNFEFEASWPPYDMGDRGMHAVETMLWHYYDDFRTHSLTGRHALESGDRELFDRCSLFLMTELEYEWPHDDFLVTGRDFENRIASPDLGGENPCWPFFTRSAYHDNRR
jgi:hypothetical protein